MTEPKKIVLTTLNARYTHASLSLRYLYANMDRLQEETVIAEFVIGEDMQRIAENILLFNPTIVGIGVYIWNAEDVSWLVDTIKKVSPYTIVVLGGPEVSYIPRRVEFSNADYIICGEGDLSFAALCKKLLLGEEIKEREIKSVSPNLLNVALPYRYYTDEDIAHRYLYVEASRGCPFECEFCLSSLDEKVRYFDEDELLRELEALWQRGARGFKFVDRTFNLNIAKASRALDFFLSKEPPFKIHFEVISEAFPSALKEKLSAFAPNTLQLEIGIQTLNEEVAKNINRKMDIQKIRENISFLERETNAHLHLDLIAGLPGESLESFKNGLNTLVSLSKAEIRVGVLKKLSGTVIGRHDKKYEMLYSDKPPYDILQTKDISFFNIQRIKRFARFWEMTHNSERFKSSLALMGAGGDMFGSFMDFSDWVYVKTLSTYQISFTRLCELVFLYLTTKMGFDEKIVANAISSDFEETGARGLPGIIKEKLLNKK